MQLPLLPMGHREKLGDSASGGMASPRGALSMRRGSEYQSDFEEVAQNSLRSQEGRYKYQRSRAFFFMYPDGWFRSVCIDLACNKIFDHCILGCILINAIMISLDDPVTGFGNSGWRIFSEVLDSVFLGIFTFEMLVKLIAMGGFLHQSGYYREAWNWLDFVVVVSGLAGFALSNTESFTILRVVRIFRPLRTISRVKGMRDLVDTLGASIPILFNVLLLSLFVFFIFGLIGVILWSKTLHQRCYGYSAQLGNFTYTSVCGSDSEVDSFHKECPEGFDCVKQAPNPFEWANWDHVGASLLIVLQCFTLDDWNIHMYHVQDGWSPFAAFYFVILTLVGAYFVLNLVLAVVTDSFTRFAIEEGDRELDSARNEMQKRATQQRELHSAAHRQEVDMSPADELFSDVFSENAPSQHNDTARLESPEALEATFAGADRSRIRSHSLYLLQGNVPGTEQGAQVLLKDERVNREWKRFTTDLNKAGRTAMKNIRRIEGVREWTDMVREVGDGTAATRRRAAGTARKQSTPDGRDSPDRDLSASRKTATRKERLKMQMDEIVASPTLSKLSPEARKLLIEFTDSAYGSNWLSQPKTQPQPQLQLQPQPQQQLQPPSLDDAAVVPMQHNPLLSSLKSTSVAVPGSPFSAPHVDSPDVTISRMGSDPHRTLRLPLPKKTVHIQQTATAVEGEESWKFQSQKKSCVDIVRNFGSEIVHHSYFTNTMSALIVFNAITMSVEHYQMEKWLIDALDLANILFVSVFAFETVVKMLVIPPRQFIADKFNVLDAVIAVVSVVEILFLSSSSFTIFRVFRLVRVVRVIKLARRWRILKHIVKTVGSSLTYMGYLLLLLILFVFVFAILGRQLFAGKITRCCTQEEHSRGIYKCYSNTDETYLYDECWMTAWRRSHFDDLYWAMIAVFQIVTEDYWSAFMYKAMSDVGWYASIYFIIVVLFGRYMLLNLFVAILLVGLEREHLLRDDTSSVDEGQLDDIDAMIDDSDEDEEPEYPPQMQYDKQQKQKLLQRNAKSAMRSEKTPALEAIESNNILSPTTLHLGDSSPRGQIVPAVRKPSLSSFSRPPNAHGAPLLPPPTPCSPLGRSNSTRLMSTTDRLPHVFPSSQSLFPPSVLHSSASQSQPLLHSVTSPTSVDPPSELLGAARREDSPLGSFNATSPEQLLSPHGNLHTNPPLGSVPSFTSHGSFGGEMIHVQSHGSLVLPMGTDSADGKKEREELLKRKKSFSRHRSQSLFRALNDAKNDSSDSDDDPDILDGSFTFAGVASPRGVSASTALQEKNSSGVRRERGLSSTSQKSNSPVHNNNTSNTVNTNHSSTATPDADVDNFADEVQDNTKSKRKRRPSRHYIPHSETKAGDEIGFRRDRFELSDWQAVVNEDGVEHEILLGLSWWCILPDNPIRVRLWHILRGDYIDFEKMIGWLIFFSCLSLVFNEKLLGDSPAAVTVLEVFDVVFTMIFLLEILIRITVYTFNSHEAGKSAYIRRAKWNFLDMMIVVVGVLMLPIQLFTNAEEFDIMYRVSRALRAGRPVRILVRSQNMKIVISALVRTIPAVFNVFAVASVSYFMFGVVSVQLFKGSFMTCNDGSDATYDDCTNETYFIAPNVLPFVDWVPDVTLQVHADAFANATTVFLIRRRWDNLYAFSFNNIGRALLTLLECAILNGWTEVLYAVVDCTNEENGAIIRDNQQYMGLLVVLWVFFGGLGIMNVFVGCVVDYFSRLKTSMDRSALLTKDQMQALRIKKILAHQTAKHRLAPPDPHRASWYNKLCYRIVHHKAFVYPIIFSIIVNVLIMTTIHYDQSEEWGRIQEISNLFFNVLFTFEAACKLGVGGWSTYVATRWNCVDLGVCISAWGELILTSLVTGGNAASIVQLLRLGRIFRLVRHFKGLKKLLLTLYYSIPALVNVGSLLFLVFFIYGVIATVFFEKIRRVEYNNLYLNTHFNFETFPASLLTLYRVATFDNWRVVMQACRISPPECSEEAGDCGSTSQLQFMLTSLFFSLFVITVGFVMLNLFIAVVLENFRESVLLPPLLQAKMDLVKMFREEWAFYDPTALQIIKAYNFIPLMLQLPSPLGFADCDFSDILPSLLHLDFPVTKDREILFPDVIDAIGETVFKIKLVDREAAKSHLDRPRSKKSDRELKKDRDRYAHGYTIGDWYAANLIKSAYQRWKGPPGCTMTRPYLLTGDLMQDIYEKSYRKFPRAVNMSPKAPSKQGAPAYRRHELTERMREERGADYLPMEKQNSALLPARNRSNSIAAMVRKVSIASTGERKRKKHGALNTAAERQEQTDIYLIIFKQHILRTIDRLKKEGRISYIVRPDATLPSKGRDGCLVVAMKSNRHISQWYL